MKKIVFLVFVILSYACVSIAYEAEIGSISSTLSQSISKSGKKSVAVVDFIDLQGNPNELGRFIAEELSADLINKSPGFDVIDRNHLKSVMTEHKLSASGLVDPKTVKKIGQIIGADVIVTGSITPFGDTIRVTCKAISTDTARVISSARGDIAKTKAIEDLLNKGIGSKDDDNTVKTISSSTPPKNTDNSKFIVTGKDFVFELVSVKLQVRQYSNALDFYFKITNKGRTRQFNIHHDYVGSDSLVLDNFENALRNPTCMLGAEIRSGESKTIKCFIQDDVSSKMKYLKIYRGAYSIDFKDDNYQFEFRNVPVILDLIDRQKNIPEKHYR